MQACKLFLNWNLLPNFSNSPSVDRQVLELWSYSLRRDAWSEEALAIRMRFEVVKVAISTTLHFRGGECS